ncbi:MAG: MFS transporter [Pseudomonadales bacterium]|nr:MFS transporter [Pseudomonadales bacterium]
MPPPNRWSGKLWLRHAWQYLKQRFLDLSILLNTNPTGDKTPLRRWLALLSISLVSFLNSLLNSATNVAIPEIANDLGIVAAAVSWIPAAFLLSNTVMLQPAGRLADIYGRKRIYITGLSLLTGATLGGYLINNIGWLLLVRSLQGIGAAMAFATGMALVMSLFDKNNRGVALGISSAFMYLGLSCGPLIGGWWTQEFGWRSVFLFPVPLMVLALFLVALSIKAEWKSSEFQSFDWAGSLLFAAGISTLFLGVSDLPSPKALLLLIVALTLMILFVRQQSQAAQPMVNFKALGKNKIFSRSLLASTCIFSSNYPLVFLFSLFLQYIKGLSPFETGQVMMAQAIMMAIVAPLSGRLADQYNPGKIATVGCLIMTIAFMSLLGVDLQTPIWLITASLMLLGIGLGLFSTSNNSSALSSIDITRLSSGSALLSLSRVAGNLLGTAMVLVLMSINLGDNQITPIYYSNLVTVIQWGLGLSCCYTLAAGYFSFTRATK